MDNLLLKAPELGALIVVVYMFLKYLTMNSREHQKSLAARDEFILNLHKEHMEARAETREALHDNAKATMNNTKALEQLRDSLSTSNCANYVPKTEGEQ